MDTSPKSSLITTALTLIGLILLASVRSSAGTCFKSIISFGDSLADTGNLLRLSPANKRPHFFFPPYGETYFHRPTGRCSDGRLIIDFIAESLGLPLVQPYLAGKDVFTNVEEFEGVNFAVAGATALDASFFWERGIINPMTNNSLGTQLGWFKETLDSLCRNPSDCHEMLRSSLFLVGEIGGNDYNHALLLNGRNIDEIRTFVTPVVDAIGSAIEELIELGAVTLMVPGNFPIGCSASYLTSFQSPNVLDYDNYGCLEWLNVFSMYHNKMLQTELNRLRKSYPHVNIIYADYYSAAMRLYQSPQKYGFKRSLSACCGGGGPYNYNSSVACGFEPSTSCIDPKMHVCWDGLHLTEAAYKLIAQGLLQGPYSNPPINTICDFLEVTSQYI